MSRKSSSDFLGRVYGRLNREYKGLSTSIGEDTLDDIYQPCSCGSEKKYKFCCYQKSREFNQLSKTEIVDRSVEFPVVECQVRADWKEDGLATVLVVRQLPNLRFLFGFLLVDTYCLGLKDAYVEANIEKWDLEAIRGRFPEPMENISYNEARSLVLGAIDYAKEQGFDPHPDWKSAKHIVEGDKPYVHLFDFVKDGKPLYISGPHDNPKAILKKLQGRDAGVHLRLGEI